MLIGRADGPAGQLHVERGAAAHCPLTRLLLTVHSQCVFGLCFHAVPTLSIHTQLREHAGGACVSGSSGKIEIQLETILEQVDSAKSVCAVGGKLGFVTNEATFEMIDIESGSTGKRANSPYVCLAGWLCVILSVCPSVSFWLL